MKDLEYNLVSDLDKNIWGGYDEELYHGGPAGVQVVYRRLEKEKCLELVDLISGLLSG